ncbi:helix-turn-helix transcriptional regulator [Actinoalloteichus spitiensis]|uniref:helix-turn-helix transcriptional regulator n=1 Tax=Actinoalloteichus spitiensis TaxID=252394 RepID=UPI0003810EED|nr:LuxR family transcriptional regulator [Actinoalloteichus spitiensis]
MRIRAPLLIGRDTELAELGDALANARKGRGSALFVVGEPGIGKSRIAAEAVGTAYEAGMVVLRGRAGSFGPSVPFRPLAEALLSLVRGGASAIEAELGPYRPVLGRLVPDWDHGDTQRDASFVVLAEALLRLMGVVGRDRGCLLVLDDLHDADLETLAVVEYLCDNLDLQPGVLLATVRSEPGAALDLADSATRRHTGRALHLERLGAAQVRVFAASCLDSDPERVPTEVTDRLWEDSAGNPLVVEELLRGMVSAGRLVPGAGGWQLVRALRTEVPDTLVRSITQRADRLGPKGEALLSAAAVLGRRFPLSIVQRVTGMDDHTLLGHLQSAVAAQLVASDDRGPDWYAFQHPLTAEALLARLTPTDRAALSARAADVVTALHPDLPGEWCQLTAVLRRAAGETSVAAGHYLEAGRRALADGAAQSAITLLEQAERLLADHGDATSRAEVVEALLYALAEAGNLERAFELAGTLDDYDTAADRTRRAALHVRLAWVTQIAGRWEDGIAQVREARRLLGEHAAPEHTAPVDAVAASLALNAPGRHRTREAEELARRAVAATDRVSLPVIACQAWRTIGTVARERDLDEAWRHFDRARRVAEEHRLPIWRIYALMGLAGNAWLAEGDTSVLAHARVEALRVGALPLAVNVDAILALDTVLRGDHEVAEHRLDAVLADATRLHLTAVVRYVLMARAVLAAHRADRPGMDRELAEFARHGGPGSQEQPLALGLARAVCALVEEDHAAAGAEFAAVLAAQAENPTTFFLAGQHGLHLLLRVVAGDAGWAEHAEVTAAPAGGMRWNRQFVLLATAVLHGRDGDAGRAEDAARRALDAAEPYPLGRALGLRLVAEAAHEGGWGEPAGWLRQAEEYFHQRGVAAPASACRALLRQVGAPVRQRRAGTDRVPVGLRELGVTSREFEVLELLVHRLGNKAIATRLHISPRTVEKHVASLITKTGRADRAGLVELAAEHR